MGLYSAIIQALGDQSLAGAVDAYAGGGGGGSPGSQIYTGAGAPSSGLGTSGDFYLNTLNGDYYKKSGSWGSPQGNLTGPAGAAGSAGATGPQGPAGTNGTNGTNGNAIYTGAGAPSTLHNNGDLYINTSNGDVYQQASGSWGSPIENITGPAGATGATGATGSSGVAAATAPLAYNSGTQTVSISQATSTTDGYLSQTDWNTFNNSLTNAEAYFNSNFASKAGSLSTANIVYVSQDIGSDSNSGSIFAPFKTIQAAVTAANATAAYGNQIIVLVSPGTYAETITLSQQGIVLKAATNAYKTDAVVINGSITIDLTGTSGGANFSAINNFTYIDGFTILNSASSGAGAISFTGSTYQRLFIDNCLVETNNIAALSLTNTGTSSGTPSTVLSRNTDYQNNTAGVATIIVAGGRIEATGDAPSLANNAGGQSVSVTGASAAGPIVQLANFAVTGQIGITDNTAVVQLSFLAIGSGSSSCISTPSSPNTGYVVVGQIGFTTTATNTITGSGVVIVAGSNAKTSSGGDIASTVIQQTFAKFPEGQTLLGAGATAVTNSMLIVKDGHITSQRTTAPTVAASSAGTGASASVANATDVAGSITLTTGTGTITNTAKVTLTFNKAYSVAPIIQLTPSNSAAGINSVQKYVTSTTTTFVINFAVAPAVSTAYSWMYHVIETQ